MSPNGGAVKLRVIVSVSLFFPARASRAGLLALVLFWEGTDLWP